MGLGAEDWGRASHPGDHHTLSQLAGSSGFLPATTSRTLYKEGPQPLASGLTLKGLHPLTIALPPDPLLWWILSFQWLLRVGLLDSCCFLSFLTRSQNSVLQSSSPTALAKTSSNATGPPGLPHCSEECSRAFEQGLFSSTSS